MVVESSKEQQNDWIVPLPLKTAANTKTNTLNK